jgi:hypothetical protein
MKELAAMPDRGIQPNPLDEQAHCATGPIHVPCELLHLAASKVSLLIDMCKVAGVQPLRRTITDIHLPGWPIKMKKTKIERVRSVDKERVGCGRKQRENELVEGLHASNRNKGVIRSTRRMCEKTKGEVRRTRTPRKE